MEGKTFDIAAPSSVNPSATSRPLIVGHRPIMSDPMMRPTQATPQPAAPAPAESVHVAKVIQVSDEIRSNLANAPTQPPVAQATPMPAVTASPQMPPTTGQQPSASIPEPVPNAQPAMAAAPEPDLSNIPHVAISHTHKKSGNIKSTLLWLLIICFLFIFGAYLLIDAGLVGSGIKLPVHIFHQSA